MRFGFTTGSCAAAAAKAAAYMLLGGRKKEDITIETPKGIPFHAILEDIQREEEWVRCAVVKDGGDDPDVTTGAFVYATVSYGTGEGILIDGGAGVGRVTRPGLRPAGRKCGNQFRSTTDDSKRSGRGLPFFWIIRAH